MAAPVLGGLLIADEVVDVFLPEWHAWSAEYRKTALESDGDSTAIDVTGGKRPLDK
jgi:hypothetical protein